ncbi:uncharacterized protein LOC129228538 [Uloborus diversus]|uniref:uncharacterized protein LOC129228538 n=1 Tax=Uloborus diversus TaxID=327109 RepID=UPI00240A0708|nr:uncharacterized protein LOC129228538 [Uloborus diversus]
MTSFGATKICELASDGRNFETTFKIQGQVYHKIGSLMPMPDDDPKFLQIYFMGSYEERVTTRCIVSPQLRSDNCQIVINADKVPTGEHAGRFNAPTVDEVAVIMVGDPANSRDLKITRRDRTVSIISDLHRSYDALQYPLIFWEGQDEYHINIKQRNPTTVFGNVCCWLYSIEWQKRGLPHTHILVWLEDKIRPEEIDQIISAEIPNPLADPELFEIVTNHMIHGPCGAFNMTSPCMEDGKFNGQVFNTYQDACRELQLLEADNHWDLTLADAALTSTPNNIRQLFAIILTTCYPTQPLALWEKYKNYMTEDILHRVKQIKQCPNLEFTPYMYNEALVLIEDLCILISHLPLSHYGMPSPDRLATDLVNTDLQREKQYNAVDLATIIANNEPLLTVEQKNIYNQVMLTVDTEQGGFFFLDAPGGTGKTFLISLILAKTRSQQKIALTIASSGIAATLLDGGRTAHSALKLPLDIHNKPNAMCNIKKKRGMAAVLQNCAIVIWDECTMAHKHSLEAFNRSMQDLKGNNKLFGGTVLLLSGDFRQTLPVIPHSTFADEINACLKQSFLWRNVKILRLTINMRVQNQNDPSAHVFSKQLLDIGNGEIELYQNTHYIKLPDDFCTAVETKSKLIESVFPDILNNYLNHNWLCNRAILATRNVDVDEINFQIQQLLPGNLMSFHSIDTVVDENEAVNFPTEFLNSLDIPGMPPHNLRLKIGSAIILLRNLNPPKLCNGTRLVIKRITGNVLEATILTGKFKGETVLLPRIPLIATESPIPFRRLQFPVRLAFAITINKSQGQTMSVCGLDLENTCFAHGQLYVACSRVGIPSNLFVFAKNRLTKNIVHKLVLI